MRQRGPARRLAVAAARGLDVASTAEIAAALGLSPRGARGIEPLGGPPIALDPPAALGPPPADSTHGSA